MLHSSNSLDIPSLLPSFPLSLLNHSLTHSLTHLLTPQLWIIMSIDFYVTHSYDRSLTLPTHALTHPRI